MKKTLNTFTLFVIMFVITFFASYSLSASFSPAFGYYAQSLNITFINFLYNMEVFFKPLFTPIVLLLFSNIWTLIKSGKLNIFKKINFHFIIFLSTVILIGLFIGIYYMIDYSILIAMVLFPFLFFSFTTIWICSLFNFLQVEDKYKKLTWYRFKKQFSKTPIGRFVFSVTGFFIFLFLYEVFFDSPSYLFLFSIFSLCILSILARLLSTFSENRSKELDAMVNEKLKAERLKTELITNVSHDIKTPLTSIINYSNIIQDKNITKEQLNDYLEIIHSKSQRLKSLIDDLIEASKAGTGNISLDLEDIDFCEIVGQIMGEFDEQLTLKNLELISQVPDEPLIINSDGKYLWRILENIFSNVSKYSLPGTRVYLELSTVDNICLLSIKNISNAPLNLSADELMEQFVQNDRSRLTDGNGLGLNIAKNLAISLGGDFNIEILGDLFQVELSFPLVNKEEIDDTFSIDNTTSINDMKS